MAEFRELSVEVAGKIDALVRKISVGRELDGEMRAELRGHVEDKVRGYLRGEVRISEADAVLLATKHFGEAGVIQGMFEGVHGVEQGMSLLKRVCVVGLVYLFVTSLVGYGLTMAWSYCYLPGSMDRARIQYGVMRLEAMPLFPQFIFDVVEPGVVLLTVFFILRWMKRGVRGMRISEGLGWGRIAMGSALYVVLLWFERSPFVMNYSLPDMAVPHYQSTSPPTWYLVVVSVRLVAFSMIGAGMWVWWCERGARTRRTLVLSLAAWGVFELSWGPMSVVVRAANESLKYGWWSVGDSFRSMEDMLTGLVFHTFWFVMVMALIVGLGGWAKDRQVESMAA